MTTTLEFFNKLYGGAPAGHFYIWIKWPGKDKRSKTLWCNTLEEAAEHVAIYNGEVNVYFGICTSNKIKESNQRAKHPDIHMMPAFVLDVDYALPSHAKPGLPATREQALAIIHAAPLPATIIVESGGGFHAYWKFREPLIFHDDDERADKTERDGADLSAADLRIEIDELCRIIDRIIGRVRLVDLPHWMKVA